MDGVVLLHGIANVAASLWRIERSLRADGYSTCNLDYPSRSKSIGELADHVDGAIAHFAGGLDGRLHFVTHSMGGLVARTWIARRRPANLGRMVMLGPPNGGSELADVLQKRAFYRHFYGPAGGELTTAASAARNRELGPPAYPVGVIAGDSTLSPASSYFILPRPNDGTVSVASSRLEGMADHITIHASHTVMLFNRRAIAQVLYFLRCGRFVRKT